jgi:hypothetical protein
VADPGRHEKLVLAKWQQAADLALDRVRRAKVVMDVVDAWTDLGIAGQALGRDLPAARVADATEEVKRKAAEKEANKPLNRDSARPTKKPTAEQVKEIDEAVKKRQFQMALDKAAQYYGIDMANVKSLKYDPTYKKADAYTDKDGTIRVGPSVFKYPDAGAARTASTVIHEVTHANQIKHHGSPADRTESATDRAGQEWSAYEYMAYRAEFKNADAIGLSADAKEFARSHAEANLRWLSEENQLKVARGEYWGMTPFKP